MTGYKKPSNDSCMRLISGKYDRIKLIGLYRATVPGRHVESP